MNERKEPMDLELFYKTTDELYEQNDHEKIQAFFEEQLREIQLRDEFPQDHRDDGSFAAAVCNEAASFFRGRNMWNRCLPLYERLLSELESMGLKDQEPYGIALMNRATAFRFMGELKKADEGFTQAEQVLTLCGSSNSYALAGLYNNHAAVSAENGDAQTAIKMYQAAVETLGDTPETFAEQALSYSGMALMYLKTGDLKSADRYADIAMEKIGNADTHPHGGAVLSARAHCCYHKGDRKQAAELFLQSAEITKRFFGENLEYQNCMENYRKACVG